MRTLFALHSVHTRLAALTVVALTALCTLATRPALAQGDSGSYGPVVAIVTPEYAEVLDGLESIVISITPRRYSAQTIELLVDGKSITGAIPAQTKFKWDTKLFIDGPHTLSVRVTDTQGFIGQAETMVYINNNNIRTGTGAQVLSWAGVQNGQNLSGTANIQLSAGGDFGVKYVFLNVNSAIAPDIKPPLASWMTNRPPYEFSLDTTRFKDGLYVLDAYAWDAMENERLAPRLTVGFYNHGLNATTLQAPTAAATTNNTEKTASSKSPTRTANAATAPSMTLPPSSSELLKTPGTYTVTTNNNGWISSSPAPSEVASPPAAYRTSTIVSARVSEPSRIARTLPEAPSVAASGSRVESGAKPGVTLAGSQATQLNASVTGSPAAATPEIAAQNPATSPRVSQPSRIARTLPAPRVETAAPPAAQPNTTLAGKANDAPLSTPQVSTSVAVPNDNTAKISEPSRIARALPQAPAPAAAKAPEVHWTAPSRFEAAQPDNAVANFIPLETPASTVVGNTAESLNLETVRMTSATRLSQPRLSALPPSALPGNVATNAPRSSSNALLSLIDGNSYTSRLVSAPPASQLRIASTLALPTMPRLALTPNLSQPSTSANATEAAAIRVARSISEPVVHVAQRNETLAAIAMRYKVPLTTLANANKLPHNARIMQGESVVLPQALQISYNGQAVTGDVAPFLIGSTSIAPFRHMFEKQGGKLEWDAVNRRVIARNGDHEVTINIGSNMALVNQEEVMMDMAAFLLSGRTMVPVRFFEKAMQAKVEWEPTTGRIYVAMTP